MTFRPIAIRSVAIAGVALTLSGCGINSIPTAEENAKARWADVQNQYQRRADLIPNLVATVKAAGAQEKDILVEVTQARASANQVKVSGDQLTDPASTTSSSGSRCPPRISSLGGWRWANAAPGLTPDTT